MKEGYKLSEFHCASNTSQPIHISSNGQDNATVSSLYKKHAADSTAETRHSDFIKKRSSTMYCSSRSIANAGKGVTPNLDSRGKVVDKSTLLFPNPSKPRVGSIEEEAKKFMGSAIIKTSSAASSPKDPVTDIIKSRSTTDSEAGRGETLASAKSSFLQPEQAPAGNSDEQLKKKLTQSLSPSPFRYDDPGRREAKLDHLVTSVPGTKGILFSNFYGSELAEKDSHRAWKIALKDHIVNTFESICLIQKLKPVPAYIVEKKRLPPEAGSTSNSTLKQ